MQFLLDRWRQNELNQAVIESLSLPGAMAEFGVYQGGSAIFIAIYATKGNKTLHLFDTFQGIPEDDTMGKHKKGEFAASLDDVKQNLKGYNVLFHPGIFPDTTKELPDDITFCLVHLDADTYQSTKAGLQYFWPKMVPHGLIVCDDYGWHCCPGVKQSIEELQLDQYISKKQLNQCILKKPL